MDEPIGKVAIVGGGTSAWMTACYLQRSFPELEIEVIEAPGIPRIGVGEATLPSLQSVVWDHLGISEERWMRKVNATFKMGIRFVNWAENPIPNKDAYYYHLFGVMGNCQGIPLAQYWAHRRLHQGVDSRLDYTCYAEPALADALRSPRFIGGGRGTHYAWHFDANLMADFLKELALERGVRLRAEQVERTELDHRGRISHVVTDAGQQVRADLFIDCTGFRRVLIGKALDEPYQDMSSALLCDSAVATQVPRNSDTRNIRPYTTATALKSGWSWDIPLVDRMGAGYVHSSNFLSTDDAVLELAALHGFDPEAQTWNRIRFPVGRNRNSWVKNCVAIGLSSNFLEPLESTALYLTYAALYQLVRFFPDRGFDERVIKQFNSELSFSYDDCRDFVQMHYCSTRRDDTAFWRANQHELHLSDSLEEKLDMYRAGLPINAVQATSTSYYADFAREFRNFWTNGSYYSVLTGMGVYPERAYAPLQHAHDARREAERAFAALRGREESLLRSLPSHADFLEQLHGKRGTVPQFHEPMRASVHSAASIAPA